MRRRIGLGAAALTLLSAGCSLSQTPTAKSSPTPPPAASLLATPVPSPSLDPGWSLHADAGQGFAVGFPDTWQFLVRDSPTYDADLKTINTSSSDLGKYFGDGFKNGQANGLKLIAAEPRSVASGFITNLSLFKTDLGPRDTAPSLDAVATSKLNLLTKNQSVTGDITRQTVQVPAGSTERLQYAMKPSDKTVNVSTFLGTFDADGHRFLYQMVIGTNVQDFAGLFDRVAKSFRLLFATAASASAAPSPTPSPAVTSPSPPPRPTGRSPSPRR